MQVDMVREVGAFEAKTKFSELLEEAHGGREILVTRRGVPMAKLIPVSDRKSDILALLAGFDEIRATAKPGPSVRSLIEEGRR
jgi:prevent-host-death family protein